MSAAGVSTAGTGAATSKMLRRRVPWVGGEDDISFLQRPLARKAAPPALLEENPKSGLLWAFQKSERALAIYVPASFDGRFRFNPLCDWSWADVEACFTAHNLPRHPLVDDAYVSIGCMPCTRRLQAGEAYRNGRWPGLEKDECGIHTGVDGEGI